MKQGVKAISHDNVTLEAWGAELRVPPDYRWQRTAVGGDENDRFAQGFYANEREKGTSLVSADAPRSSGVP